MASYEPVVKNGASGAIFYVALMDMAGSGLFKANPTLASGDVKISLDGGAFANLTTLPAVTPASGKAVKVTLSQAETNADSLSIVFSDAAGAEWADLFVNIQTVVANFDTLSGRIPAALVSGRVDASVGAMAADVLTPAAIKGYGLATVGVGSTTTSVVTSAFAPSGAVADQFKDRSILFDDDTTTTTLRGCARRITASSNAANPTFTVDALPAAPASGDKFSVV